MIRRKNPDIYFHKQKRKRTASFFTLSFYSTPHYSFGGRNPLLVFTITLSNTMNIDGKKRRRGMTVGKTAKSKKAIVALTEDSKDIEIFEGL